MYPVGCEELVTTINSSVNNKEMPHEMDLTSILG